MAELTLAALSLMVAALAALAATASADSPALTVTAPAATDYAQGSVPAAAFACPGATCSVVVDGGGAIDNGGALPGAPGSHTFTVTATASDGGSASQTGAYTVSAPPQAAIGAPADGQSYNADAVPNAAFSCTADQYSPLTTCQAMVDGAGVSNGASLAATPGPHTLNVTATDADGLSSPTATVTYTVDRPPTCSDVSQTTNEGVEVSVALSCSDPNAPIERYGIVGGPHHGSLSRSHGALVYTPDAGFAGIDTFTYDGISADGSSATHHVTITVLAPPDAHIATPASGQVYDVGQTVPTRFDCADEAHGPGIATCVDSRGAGGGTGTLDTSTEGPHTYTVTAASQDGQTGKASINYTVVGRSPEVVINAPVNNASYLWTALPPADFTCLPGAGSTVQSCKATVGGQPISGGQSLPDAFGTHTLSVTATDADGLSTTQTAIYTVTYSAVPPPPVSIQAPAQGAAYRLGQTVRARYSCLATTTGSALKSCVGSVGAGRPIDTRTLGAHRFSVSATNAQGDSTMETVTYRVVPTTNRFAVVGLRATRAGEARLTLRLPGPGSVQVVAVAWNATHRTAVRRLAYGRASVSARRGGPLSVLITPSAAGRQLQRRHGARPVVALKIRYAPTGARARVVRTRAFPIG